MSAVIDVNPTDVDWTSNVYVLWFGAYGSTRLKVWANSLDAALDEAVDWLVERAPGLLADEEVNEAYKEAIAEGLSDDAAHEKATIDTTCAGNTGNYLHSWEWGVLKSDRS